MHVCPIVNSNDDEGQEVCAGNYQQKGAAVRIVNFNENEIQKVGHI